MSYDEKVKELNRKNRIAGCIAALLGIISGIIILSVVPGMIKKQYAVFILLPMLIPAALIAVGVVNICSPDKRLKKMWKSVGIDDDSEITAVFDNRTVLDKYDEDYAVYGDLIINLESIKAYRAGDISSISRKDIRDTDSEGRSRMTYTYYITFKLCKNAAYKKDTMSFNSKFMRDEAYELIMNMTSLN